MNADITKIVAAGATVLFLAIPADAKKAHPDRASTDRTVPAVQVTSIDPETAAQLNKKALKAQRKAERRHLLNVKLGFIGFHIL